MAYQPNPNDPYRAGLSEEEIRPQAHPNSLDNELPADPTLAEGSSPSGAKVAMFAVAIAVVLGALFYGFNTTNVNQAGTAPPNQTAQTQPATPPAAPPGMRDVTPRNNDQPGTTTGAATNRPAAPAEPSTDMNKTTPPAAPASKQ